MMKPGQSTIEYILLVSIAIIALLSAKFFIDIKDNAFSRHFEKTVNVLTAQQK